MTTRGVAAKKLISLEGDRPRPEMSEEEKRKREKLIQVSARGDMLQFSLGQDCRACFEEDTT